MMMKRILSVALLATSTAVMACWAPGSSIWENYPSRFFRLEAAPYRAYNPASMTNSTVMLPGKFEVVGDLPRYTLRSTEAGLWFLRMPYHSGEAVLLQFHPGAPENEAYTMLGAYSLYDYSMIWFLLERKWTFGPGLFRLIVYRDDEVYAADFEVEVEQ